MKRSNYFFFVVFVICSSCVKTFDNSNDMQVFLSDNANGYNYSKDINGVEYELEYRPTDLMVLQELGADYTPNDTEIDSLRRHYSKYLYFNLSMSKGKRELLSNFSGDRTGYSELSNLLAFEASSKIYITTFSKDTIRMLDFVYPKTYGTSRTTTLLLVYKRSDVLLKNTHINMVIEDFGMSTGDAKFKIDTQPLISEPTINF